VTWHTLASPGQEVPVAVSLAQVRRGLLDHGVVHADALSVDDRRQLGSRSGVVKNGKVERDRGAGEVVDADRE